MVTLTTDKPSDTDSPPVDGEGSEGTDAVDSQATEQAQTIMDGLAEQPEVCEALYELLQEKYNPTPQPESAPTSKVPEMMDTNGMPTD